MSETKDAMLAIGSLYFLYCFVHHWASTYLITGLTGVIVGVVLGLFTTIIVTYSILRSLNVLDIIWVALKVFHGSPDNKSETTTPEPTATPVAPKFPEPFAFKSGPFKPGAFTPYKRVNRVGKGTIRTRIYETGKSPQVF